MTLGLEYVSSLLAESDISALKCNKDYFNAEEQDIYLKVVSFVEQHGGFPSQKLVAEWAGEPLPKTEEVPSFYAHSLKQRHIHSVLSKTLYLVQDQLNLGKSENALEILQTNLLKLVMEVSPTEIVDYRNAVDLILPEYKKTLKETDPGIMTGWETMDGMCNGLQPSDVLSIVGRPAAGKTFNVLSVALHTWLVQSKAPLVISMEMPPLSLCQRLTAMMTHTPLTYLKKAELSTKGYKSMAEQLVTAKENSTPFWIVDGNLASTVEDLWMYCRQMNPNVLFIDGAYLLQHPNKRLDRYTKVAENVELIKRHIASELGIPVVASWQFSREAAKKAKKKNAEVADLEDIGYSDAIGQISSLVIGLFEQESIKTQKHRVMTILKGRDGQVGSFKINWDFMKMDFREVSEEDEDAGDLLFL